MVGDRFHKLARRLVREDSYHFIVAPAIADLQFEAHLGQRARLRAYRAAWLAVLGALADELIRDVVSTCTRCAIGRAAAASGLAIALQAALFMWMWSFNPVEHPLAFLLLLPALVSGAWPAALLPSAAILARSRVRGASRVVLIGSAALALFVLGAADQGVTETNQMFREQMFTASGSAGPPARGPQEQTLAQLWDRGDRDARVAVHLRLSILGLTTAWATLGLALARARWFVAVAIGLLAYASQFFSPFLASPEDAARLPVWSPWIPVAVLLFTAGILQAYAKRFGEARPESTT
jgi:hypothetical protein